MQQSLKIKNTQILGCNYNNFIIKFILHLKNGLDLIIVNKFFVENFKKSNDQKSK